MTKVVFKWSKWLSISLISLLVAIAIALAVVLFTTPGLKLALWGAEKFVPQLKVESYQGRFSRALRLMVLCLKMTHLTLMCRLAQSRWQLMLLV
jgi:autotransporter translocation and assembly factor TamB